jgi:hypothetical protein
MGTLLVDWFIRNIVLPRYKNIKSPGFIVINFKPPKANEVYFRQVLFPEDIVAKIETIFDRLNKKNKKNIIILYNIGASLGYNFAKIFSVPNVNKNNRDEIEKYFKFAFKWNFSTWCKDAQITEFDLDNKIIKLELDEHIICRKNGKGYILTEGAEAGFGKFLFCDNTMETIQEKCQGRKDKICKTIWASENYFKEHNIPYKKGEVLFEIDNPLDEKIYNSIQKPRYCTKSTYDLIKNKIFNINEGHITFKNEVFFDCTVLLYYLIEKYLPTDKKSQEELFTLGLEYGEKLAEHEKLEFIPQILSALGWGDTYITKKETIIVQINYFPWSSIIKEGVEFYLFRGMLSGMITKVLNRKISFTKYEKMIKNNSLTMIFRE